MAEHVGYVSGPYCAGCGLKLLHGEELPGKPPPLPLSELRERLDRVRDEIRLRFSIETDVWREVVNDLDWCIARLKEGERG